MCVVGERVGRGRGPRPGPAAAALRGEHPQREQGEEDQQGDRGTVTVKRGDSLLGRVGPAAVAGKLTNGRHRKPLDRQVTDALPDEKGGRGRFDYPDTLRKHTG